MKKRILSILCAVSLMFGLAVTTQAATVRQPGSCELLHTVSYAQLNASLKLTFDECYGTVEYPGWGPIPVVREGSKMHVEFIEGNLGKELYTNYPIRLEEQSNYFKGRHVYYDPQTNELISPVIDVCANYQWFSDSDRFGMLGTRATADDVRNGIAFGKEGENKYWYKMYNGFNDYKFNTEDAYNWVTIDLPSIYYAIAINDAQINEFMNTGVMSFAPPQSAEDPDFAWKCSFPNSNMKAILFNGIASVNYRMPSDWAAETVEKANEIEITAHLADYYGDTYYRNDMTRGEFAKMIIKALENSIGLDAETLANNTEIDFNDVYYADYEIFAAAEIGIVNGVGEGNFEPDKPVTRQEIAVMFYRALNYVESVTSKTLVSGISTDISRFADSGSVADWAKDGVGALVNLGIINGVTDMELSPVTNTTIEQAIALTMRVHDKITN